MKAARKPAPYLPPVMRRTSRPAISEPAMPMSIVWGMVMGSRPGSARRARPPRIRPKMASPMRYPIMRLTLLAAPAGHGWPGGQRSASIRRAPGGRHRLPGVTSENRQRAVARRRRSECGRRAPVLVRHRAHVELQHTTLAQRPVVDPCPPQGAPVPARAGDVAVQLRRARRADLQAPPTAERDRRAREQRAADDLERRTRRDRPEAEHRPHRPARQATEVVVAGQAVGRVAEQRLDRALGLGALPRLAGEDRHPRRLQVVLVARRVLGRPETRPNRGPPFFASGRRPENRPEPSPPTAAPPLPSDNPP